GVQQEEVTLGSISRDLEVVVHLLECVMVAIQPNVTNPGGWYETSNAFHHPQSGAKDRHKRELLAAHAHPGGTFERRLHGRRLERQFTRRLIGNERRDLVDEFL